MQKLVNNTHLVKQRVELRLKRRLLLHLLLGPAPAVLLMIYDVKGVQRECVTQCAAGRALPAAKHLGRLIKS